MGAKIGIVDEPKVVVGLDFGTSFSGFAYALRADPDKIFIFYDWPKQAEGGGLRYCKTKTNLLYYAGASDDPEETFELRDWGWPAFVRYTSANLSVAESDGSTTDLDFEVVQDFEIDLTACPGSEKKPASSAGYFLSLFKLHLAPNQAYTAPALPRGLTAKRAIADFLSRIAKLILEEVQNSFGDYISLDDVQWCLTVPAIWDDIAKKEMRECSELAGLVQGPLSKDTGSPHSLRLFVEPEAASVYCQDWLRPRTVKDNSSLLRKGSKFLVVDCGGGTVDLVLHEKLGAAPTLSVREVQESSGDLCGGSRVDDEFLQFLRRKISCFTRFEREHPTIVLAVLKDWEEIKDRFDGEHGDEDMVLPPKLAEMWESTYQGASLFAQSCDELKLTNDDLESIFNPTVTRILELIEERMVPDLNAIMVVGGFSGSPYLMKRIRDTFGSRVAVYRPPNPGSAVCRGAVMMGTRSDIVVSRISKKTYGVRVARPFIAGVHSEEFKVERNPGQFYCNDVFGVFVRKGDEVRFDDCVQNVYFPLSGTQDELEIELHSSDCRDVKFISDAGAKKEGKFTTKIPTEEALGFLPKVEVSMFFGRSEIQVTAIGKNFDSEKEGMLPVKFEGTGIY